MVSEKDGQFFIMLDMKPSLLSAEVVSTILVISSLNATQKNTVTRFDQLRLITSLIVILAGFKQKHKSK